MSAAITALVEAVKIMVSGLGTAFEGLKVIAGQIGPAWVSVKTIVSAFLTKLFAIGLSIMYTFNPYVPPSTDDVIKAADQENVRMTFAAWADPQISNVLLSREPYIRAASDDLRNAQSQVDALLIAGDITENGLECEYDIVYNHIYDTGVSHFITAVGNHDVRLRNYSKIVEQFTSFTNSLNQEAGNDLSIDALHYSYEINGYTFIVMGTDRYDSINYTEFEAAYLNNAQLTWLEETLSKSVVDKKPVFIMLHQPLNGMHNLPSSWHSALYNEDTGGVGEQSDELYEIMNRYDNVFFITGHIHLDFGEYTYEKAGKVHSINLPSTTIENVDGTYLERGTGFMVEVYDNEVLFRARNFAQGKYVSEYDFAIPLV